MNKKKSSVYKIIISIFLSFFLLEVNKKIYFLFFNNLYRIIIKIVCQIKLYFIICNNLIISI